MKKLIGVAALALCGLAGAQVTPPEVARQQQQELKRGDPPRWTRPDRTEAAQLATLRKEINAALREALEACKQQGAGANSDCVKEARTIAQADMANARQIHLASRDLSRTFETSGK
ncbi:MULTISPECIES: hypothetical protein [unclassified Duganella]|uniref:hypothetical protein n=1 Tax=unclassified Duganella TaxID=2636909 RepID=UPI0006F767D3|nr:MULTISPECIES: hypothetical protein [unclassified Duganella]KQV46580.1 hypothetical protein ASD07_14020 [Duganella sp. Root336D2]KRC02373.1 hypothetical protein ASE26_20200 [Duganella sp. Root198D2]